MNVDLEKFQVLELSQVAEVLHVSEDTIRNLRRTKQLKPFRVGRHDRWSTAAIRRFIEDADGADA